MPDHIITIRPPDDLGRIVLWCRYCQKPIFRSFDVSVETAIQITKAHNNKEN